jgi:alpha-ribazole phosphatase
MRLYLVRHPRPAIGQDLCYGASDVPVADNEMNRVLAALRAAGLPGELPVYTSPLQRCAALAQRLHARALHIDARLAEMDFGRWEMQPWSAIARDEVDAWAADLLHYRPGGAESVLDVARRVAGFLDELRSTGEPHALLICHAGTLRLLTQMARRLTLDQAALQAAQTAHHIGHGELLMLEV